MVLDTVTSWLLGLGSSASKGGQGAPVAGRGSGHTGSWPSMRRWRATSRQLCGLWPLVVGGQVPVLGVPLGRALSGAGMVCADHLSWFRKGLISAPSMFVLGLNGLGKSSLVRRIITGLAYQGVHTMVLGDIKPDHVDLIRALGGQVITIGHGHAGINPLDAGNLDEAVELLRDHPRERNALLQAAHERKKNMVLTLIHLNRRQPPSEREESIIDQAVTVLEERGGQPVLADLLEVVREAPASLRAVANDRGDIGYYRSVTEGLEVSLTALMHGRMGAIFSARTTTPMLMDRSVVFDVSSLISDHSDTQAAVLLACWSYGFATVEIAQCLADAGVAPRRFYNLVMDELWRILRASSGMVERIDSLTRLNRSIGVGQIMCTHSMADADTLASQEDRVKAQGFIERSKMLVLGGLPMRETELLGTVVPFSKAERELLASWAAPGGFDPHEGRTSVPVGQGKFLLKTSAAPGTSFQVDLVDVERDLHNTNKRWDRAS